MSVERILGERLAAAERETERLRGVCEDWGRNYQSWVDATHAAEARADAAERKVAEAWDEGYAKAVRDGAPTAPAQRPGNPYRLALPHPSTDPDER